MNTDNSPYKAQNLTAIAVTTLRAVTSKILMKS